MVDVLSTCCGGAAAEPAQLGIAECALDTQSRCAGVSETLDGDRVSVKIDTLKEQHQATVAQTKAMLGSSDMRSGRGSD